MNSIYGVQINNRYASFEDNEEADPSELLKQVECKNKAEKEAKKVPKTNTKVERPKTAKKSTEVTTNQKNKTGEERKEKTSEKELANRDENRPKKARDENEKISRENRSPKENKFSAGKTRGTDMANRPRRGGGPVRNKDDGFGGKFEVFGEKQANDHENKSRPARGRGRGTRGTFAGREGKRVFDRHSGSDKTGIKHQDKKQGGGRANWGSTNDQIDASLTEEKQEMNTSTDEPENQDPNVSKEEIKDESVPTEPEVKQMTLDEYRKMQKDKQPKKDFNIRKAGEGVDERQWKDTFQLAKKKDDKKDGEEDDEDDEDYDEAKEGKKKKTLNIEITYRDDRRGGRGRGRGPGDRGRREVGAGSGAGGRPGRSFGSGGRGGPGKKVRAPNVRNEDDFPALPVRVQ
ncbi:DgyrCDS1598 [Dimorphilus gyrociliatus]|uniref:DgyrCDS1598 n=1 Tax=Dimorphilus gyrociliatus TaxID=2664684 RepID=A0A7I8V9A9_9ANNE|nr:DgyrCDS1598 [Dimorphilus gyrociliatus]